MPLEVKMLKNAMLSSGMKGVLTRLVGANLTHAAGKPPKMSNLNAFGQKAPGVNGLMG